MLSWTRALDQRSQCGSDGWPTALTTPFPQSPSLPYLWGNRVQAYENHFAFLSVWLENSICSSAKSVLLVGSSWSRGQRWSEGLKAGLMQKITEYPVLEGSHKDHQVHLPASHRTAQTHCAPSCWVGPAVFVRWSGESFGICMSWDHLWVFKQCVSLCQAKSAEEDFGICFETWSCS